MTETFKVEVFFDLSATGGAFFTLDDATKGLLDGATYTLGGDVAIDVTSQVLNASTRRGRSRQQDVINPGSASATFLNLDRTYDPTYVSSPYNGNIKPGKRVRISGPAGATIFDGYIDDWNLDYNLPAQFATASITAFDALAQVGAKELAAHTATAQAAGTRVSAILDRAEVVFPGGLRSIDTGTATLQADAVTANTNALQYLQTVNRSEQGYLYATADGVLKFQGRLTILNRTAGVTFSTSSYAFDEISLEYGSELLYNRVVVNRTGGTAQTASDTASQAAYGIRTLSTTGLLYDSDAQSLDMAGYLLNKYASPELRFASLSCQLETRGDAEIAGILALDITDIVTITLTPPGGGAAISKTSIIEGISHQISADPRSHKVTFSFGDYDSRAFLVLDDPTLGKLDSNALAL